MRAWRSLIACRIGTPIQNSDLAARAQQAPQFTRQALGRITLVKYKCYPGQIHRGVRYINDG